MGKHKPIYDQASASTFLVQRSLTRLEPPLTRSHRADDCGDYVVVKNAKKVRVTGRKAEQKLYRHHTQFPGGLKEIPYATMLDRKPEEVRPRSSTPSSSPRAGSSCSGPAGRVDDRAQGAGTDASRSWCALHRPQIIRRAVSGMLPKNRLRAKRLERLLIFADADTPHEQNLLKDHAAEFGQTFKRARDVEQLAAHVKDAAVAEQQ